MAKKLEFRSAFAVYTSKRKLGEGGAGTVYESSDESGAPVAVKLLDPVKTTRERLKRFRNEILFGTNIKHDGVVRILDHGLVQIDGKDALFYVMPLYLSTMRDVLGIGLTVSEKLLLFSTLLDGVEAAHLSGVTHRDLKPENVLFDSAKNCLVVADFGVAHFEQEELYTLVETRPGTRLANFVYAAPEQRVRGQPVDRRADIYALGLMLHEFFTGMVPQGTGYKRISAVEGAPPYLDPIVDAMIRNNPADRLATVDEVKKRLIAEQQSFVARQKIDQLTKTVVPEATVDDPLVRDPIRIVDLDTRGTGVSAILNQNPNPTWIELYRNMSGVSFFMGADFRNFPIGNGRIELQAYDDRQYQHVIDQTKQGIEATNKAYERVARQAAEQQVARERQRLQQEAEAERRRQQLREKLSI